MDNLQEIIESYLRLSKKDQKTFRKETKLKKRGSKGILVLLVVIIAAGGWFGVLPYMYEKGSALMDAGNWDEAISTYNMISFYSDSLDKVKQCNELKAQEAYETEQARLKAEYDTAAALLGECKYDEAIAAFTAIGNYSDASAQIEIAVAAKKQAAYDSAAAMLDEGRYDEAITAFTALADFSDAAAKVEVAQTAKKQAAYDEAAAMLDEGRYDEAITAFTALADFSDAAAKVEVAQTAKKQAAYDEAAAMLDEGRYDEAITAFTALADFSDAAAKVEVAQTAKKQAAYADAVAMYNAGSFRAAHDAFAALGDFKDSAAKAENAKQYYPTATVDNSSIFTSVGRKSIITAIVTSVAEIDDLTIECLDGQTTSFTVSNGNFVALVNKAAAVKESVLEDGVLKITIEGGNVTGNATVVIKDRDNYELARIDVSNTGLTDIQNNNVRKVNYMADTQFFLYDDHDAYVLNFSLKDANEVRLAACCFVDVRIVNENDVVVYEGSHFLTEDNFSTWTSNWYGERKLAGLYIQPEEILEGDTTSGTVYFTINLPDGRGFAESKTSASDLPTHDATEDCMLIHPAMPVSTSYYDRITVKVTELTYEFIARKNGNVDLEIKFAGEKTYDKEGNSHSEAGRIGYKLYDPDGYVAKSGSVSTTDVNVGEKFRDATLTFRDIAPGEYKIVLLDVD